MVLWWEATPTSLHSADYPADHTSKSEHQHSVLEWENKELWVAGVRRNSRPELTINRASSFNFS